MQAATGEINTQSSDCKRATGARTVYVWCDGRTAIAQQAADRAISLSVALAEVSTPRFFGKAISYSALEKKVGVLRGVACKPVWNAEREAILWKCIDGRMTQDEAFESANDARFGKAVTVPAFKERIHILKKRVAQKLAALEAEMVLALPEPQPVPPVPFKPVRRRVEHLFGDAPVVMRKPRAAGGFSMMGGGQ